MIGYYVHHHGAGHTHRFLAIRALLPDLVGLSSAARPAGIDDDGWIALPHDATQATAIDPTAGGALHWAPLREPGLAARTAAFAAWVARCRPEAIVVDVSVEIALTARLLSVPTVVIAQHGERTDDAHLLGYRSAAAVAALWPRGTAPDPPGSDGRLHHVGPISRFDHLEVDDHAPGARGSVALLLGRGGHDLPIDRVKATIRSTSAGWDWTVIGAAPELGGTDPTPGALWQHLRRADVVVAAAGNNAVAEIAAARRPLIAIPQDRPFGEQVAHADTLRAQGLATVVEAWPEPGRWPALLDDARELGGDRWAEYHDGRGADRLAELVTRVAARR